ncbi:SRPBCC domain-containing protein [Paenibacillus sp. SC116]|uniref:SRPBCC family protein n=1 Tax=Paenibacillus sp. SC116 TaxID=2968986 RepID=UPI00215ABA78|nr:SRPBCC domain-containing protein [Paenibacillus sp. SC116]MCR8845387.1 SRPBCC domain-containing protein [Paenibacillus sp. SC116]
MTIIQQIHIENGQDQVWQAWLEAGHLVKWFSPAAEIEATVGGKFELYFDPFNKNSMSTIGCCILHLEPYQSFTFQWKGPDPFAGVMNQEDHLTEVKVVLHPVANGTNILLSHSGWHNPDSMETQQAIEWHKGAWANMLSSLKSYLESTNEDTQIKSCEGCS